MKKLLDEQTAAFERSIKAQTTALVFAQLIATKQSQFEVNGKILDAQRAAQEITGNVFTSYRKHGEV